jgi:N utilization substance protein A
VLPRPLWRRKRHSRQARSRTGDLRLWRVVEVVETVEDYFKQVDLKQARSCSRVPSWAISSSIRCRPIDLGRIDAQSAKQVIFQKVRDAERDRQFEEFKDRVGEIITGVVKSVEFGHVVVNLGRAEGVIRRDQQIPREVARVGDRVRSLIMKVAAKTAARRSSSAARIPSS